MKKHNLEFKIKELEIIAQELKSSICPLRVGATQAVPGEGNPDADILFIGEAPGEQEDKLGRPFVGAAGKLLDKLLASIDLKREDVFIANIEKFRPPGNRDPLPEEISACFPFLERQIKIIQPKLIITLGRHALKKMFEWDRDKIIEKNISIGEFHGKLIKGKKGDYFPSYHPAAGLYHPSTKIEIEKDFQKIPPILHYLPCK
ncbi:MAG: Phage SPO1 DNA polymerase-related protein [Berkelbacteria bacterium GW2011_GWA2_35_9]|uniref:Type-4 uracil-DNA glycosylase n=1 Tax=Berkelbacteria bacterium GW2011_GWA2_35_9 TaxID=1618333 RepID=A0A0G0FNK9_9BACT|nr:MAG: Phage SPO1 DNA polymerase-related protein [Berkelbacteria bacterium GW2011_GWA2_35_9]